jgi:protocatechuate 4,5-dioxygenase beta chain
VATIVGGISTSHVPSIGAAIARGEMQSDYWRPFFDAFSPIRRWLDEVRPDVAIVFYNDHGLNFFLNAMPTFAVGAATSYRHSDEGWGLPTAAPFAGTPALSWHLIDSLVHENFDLCMCQEMLVDHAFTIPAQLLWPERPPTLRFIPIHINTVQHALPSPARCYELGRAVGRAIAGYPDELRVVVIGTGGLSHQLDGTRAGFINRPFDAYCLDRTVNDAEELAAISTLDLIDAAGSQGAEFVMWLAMRGALTGRMRAREQTYHAPISNTAGGVLLLEPV